MHNNIVARGQKARPEHQTTKCVLIRPVKSWPGRTRRARLTCRTTLSLRPSRWHPVLRISIFRTIVVVSHACERGPRRNARAVIDQKPSAILWPTARDVDVVGLTADAASRRRGRSRSEISISTRRSASRKVRTFRPTRAYKSGEQSRGGGGGVEGVRVREVDGPGIPRRRTSRVLHCPEPTWSKRSTGFVSETVDRRTPFAPGSGTGLLFGSRSRFLQHSGRNRRVPTVRTRTPSFEVSEGQSIPAIGSVPTVGVTTTEQCEPIRLNVYTGIRRWSNLNCIQQQFPIDLGHIGT